MTVFKKSAQILLLLSLGFIASSSFADNPAINTDHNGLAIHGYDPVSFFTTEIAQRGKEQFQYLWADATWLFASEQNRRAFISSPEHYSPQYGGFCAYAASFGQFADIEPQAWTVKNDKLYLNFSLGVRKKWRANAEELIGDADILWPNMGAKE